MLRLVITACERAIKLNIADEWVRPTLLGAAFDLGTPDKAEELARAVIDMDWASIMFGLGKVMPATSPRCWPVRSSTDIFLVAAVWPESLGSNILTSKFSLVNMTLFLWTLFGGQSPIRL